MRLFLFSFACVCALTVLNTSQAEAQPRQPRVIQLERMVVHGRRQSPGAFYVLHRATLGYDIGELRTRFIGKVVASVRRRPF